MCRCGLMALVYQSGSEAAQRSRLKPPLASGSNPMLPESQTCSMGFQISFPQSPWVLKRPKRLFYTTTPGRLGRSVVAARHALRLRRPGRRTGWQPVLLEIWALALLRCTGGSQATEGLTGLSSQASSSMFTSRVPAGSRLCSAGLSVLREFLFCPHSLEPKAPGEVFHYPGNLSKTIRPKFLRCYCRRAQHAVPVRSLGRSLFPRTRDPFPL